MITENQQRLLDQCEDGQMTSLDLVQVDAGYSNVKVLSLLRHLERRGYVEILRREPRRTPVRHRGRRKILLQTVYHFRLTAEGLAQHAPPPGWPEG